MGALRACSEFGKQFLEDLCFDEDEWMEPPGKDVQRTEQLLKVCLAGTISAAQRLSQSSFAVLQLLLPKVPWPHERVRLLLLGRTFRGLIDSLGFPGILPHNYHISGGSSWLAEEDCQALAFDWHLLRDRFLDPTEDWLRIAEEANSRLFLRAKSPLDLINVAFHEVKERLATGGCRDLALINDVNTYTDERLQPIGH